MNAGHDHAGQPQPQEIAAYVRDLSGELALLALAAGLTSTAEVLAAARDRAAAEHDALNAEAA